MPSCANGAGARTVRFADPQRWPHRAPTFRVSGASDRFDAIRRERTRQFDEEAEEMNGKDLGRDRS